MPKHPIIKKLSRVNKRLMGMTRSASMPQKNGKTSNVDEEAKKIRLIRPKSKPRSRSNMLINGSTAPPMANWRVMAKYRDRGMPRFVVPDMR